MIYQKGKILPVGKDDPEALAFRNKWALIQDAEEKLQDAKTGREAPNVFTNGAKSKAALVRNRKDELKEAEEKNVWKMADFWSWLVDLGYAGFEVSERFLQGFSDKMHSPECPSIREQAREWLRGKGYVLAGDLWIKVTARPRSR